MAELQFRPMAIPAVVRTATGAGREKIVWNDELSFIRENPKDKDGNVQPYLVWTYENEEADPEKGRAKALNGANSRKQSVVERLREDAPEHNWVLTTRMISEPDATKHEAGVWVEYRGTFTAAQVAENAAKHEARSQATIERQAKARAAREAAEGTDAAKVSKVAKGGSKTAKVA